MADLTTVFSPIIQGVAGSAWWLIIIVFFVVGIGALFFLVWFSGLLVHRPYKVLVVISRGAGALELRTATGRFIKGGKFAIHFGANEADKITQAPAESFINFGNWVAFHREAFDDYVPCNIKYATDSLRLDPSMNPAAKLAFSSLVKEDVLRMQNQGILEKYGVLIAGCAMAIILGLAFLIGAGMVSNAQASTAQPLQDVATKLSNATIIIQQQPTNTSNPYNPIGYPGSQGNNPLKPPG